LGPGIDNIIKIWNKSSCPHLRLIQASNTDLEAKEGQPKDKGEEDLDEDEEDLDGDSIQSYSDAELSEDEEQKEGKEETKEEEEPVDEQGKLRYHSLRWWNHYRKKFLPDHVRVCFLLCHNPKVMQYAKDNPDPEDRQALERLLQKEFINPNVGTSEEREREFTMVLDNFNRLE
jgi:hypothetical protein